ncbi:MAG: hypothetical protein HF978_00305 [Desulfobacteraceae bacterium]|nr:hypothetical protein [Desulfobacteraceae bacterium]MBC2753975.1 hypothetical protein [Desulfobacteraceae bacterium]
MSSLKKCFNIRSRDFIHAGEASITVQQLLKQMRFDSALIRRIAICGYEGEMNVVMHGGDGLYCVEIKTDKIMLDISDKGRSVHQFRLLNHAWKTI